MPSHGSVQDCSKHMLCRLGNAFETFEAEMKDQGYWDKVTLVAVSDFGRTLTANNVEGSDHGKLCGGEKWIESSGYASSNIIPFFLQVGAATIS